MCKLLRMSLFLGLVICMIAGGAMAQSDPVLPKFSDASVLFSPAPPIDPVLRMQGERALIQDHLSRVEAFLRSRDVSDLSPYLVAERQYNLDRLHLYWLKGEFPRNTDFPGQIMPYFIDNEGRACAVAHLMIESGHRAVAEKVARVENNAWLKDMRTPEAFQWIAESGLTAEESAMIQPCYPNPCWGDPCCESPDPCCGSPDPCCGNPDPRCANPCWGCSENGPVVCGLNGRTYNNECDACTQGGGTNYLGPCQNNGS